MLRNIIICSSIFLSISCATAGELALNTAAGALGNMLDRRVEKALGNDVEEADKKLEPQLKEFTVVDENDKEIK